MWVQNGFEMVYTLFATLENNYSCKGCGEESEVGMLLPRSPKVPIFSPGEV